MENYIVSARKYRPSSFKTVVGQHSLTHTLKSAIDTGRLAHAYLFCGPRGVGKTSCARIFAKTINCLHPLADGESCNECESCVAFNEQRSYNIVELDAASNNSVDDIRNLTDQVRIPPQIGKYKVFIIDEVHMLSTAAFNAFLKTLEEPPAHAIFILATTEKHKILPTILSRCQIYDFSRITIQDIVEQLQYIASQEGITADPAALNVIAQKSDGAMRDALSIFDQVAASSGGNITYRSAIEGLNVLDYEYYFNLVDTFLQGDIPQALLIYKDIRDHGFDSAFFVNGIAAHLRDLMVARTPATISLLEVSKEVAQRYVQQGAKCSPHFLYKAMDLCNDCDLNYRTASNKQFLVELTLIKLCQILNPTPAGDDGKTTLKKVEVASSAAPVNTPSPQVVSGTNSVNITESPVSNYTSPAHHATVTHKAAPRTAPAQGINIPRISINQVNNSTEASQSNSEETVAGNNMPFNHSQLISVWEKFIADNPKEVVLVNAMRSANPEITSDKHTITLEVDNIGQVECINDPTSKLLPYLRQELHNERICLSVSVSQNIERTKILSPCDIVADMMTRNPAVKNLINSFELGIA